MFTAGLINMDKLRDHHVQHDVAEGRPQYRESRWERAVKVFWYLCKLTCMSAPHSDLGTGPRVRRGPLKPGGRIEGRFEETILKNNLFPQISAKYWPLSSSKYLLLQTCL